MKKIQINYKIYVIPIMWIMVCGFWLFKDITSFAIYFGISGIVGMFIDQFENKYVMDKSLYNKEGFNKVAKEQGKAFIFSWIGIPFWIICKLDKYERLPKWIRIE